MSRKCLFLSSPQHMTVRFRNPSSTVDRGLSSFRSTKRTCIRCCRSHHPKFMQVDDSLSSLFSLNSVSLLLLSLFSVQFSHAAGATAGSGRASRMSALAGHSSSPVKLFSFSFFSSFYNISFQFFIFSKVLL